MSEHTQLDKKRSDAERDLRRSEEHTRLILESAKGFAIFTTDADGIIDSWNAGAAHIFGWSEEDILGQNGDLLFTPEDAPRVSLRKKWRWHLRKDGSRVFISGAQCSDWRDGASAACSRKSNAAFDKFF